MLGVIENERVDVVRSASYPALAYLSGTQVSDWEESPYSMMLQLYGKSLDAKFGRLLQGAQDFFTAFEYYHCARLEPGKRIEFEALLNAGVKGSTYDAAADLINASLTVSRLRTFSSINRQRVSGLIAEFNKSQLEVENLLKRHARASFEAQASDLKIAQQIIDDVNQITASWRLGNAIAYIQLNNLPVDDASALTEAEISALNAIGSWFAKALAFKL
jgi:hypothetical protein